MCTRGTWLVLVRANQTRRGPGGHVRRQHRAEFPVALRVKFCLNPYSLPWMFARCESPVYHMWFLKQEPLSGSFGALDNLSPRWAKEHGFKTIIALLKATALVTQGYFQLYNASLKYLTEYTRAALARPGFCTSGKHAPRG